VFWRAGKLLYTDDNYTCEVSLMTTVEGAGNKLHMDLGIYNVALLIYYQFYLPSNITQAT
jgi:hypothetical protein